MKKDSNSRLQHYGFLDRNHRIIMTYSRSKKARSLSTSSTDAVLIDNTAHNIENTIISYPARHHHQSTEYDCVLSDKSHHHQSDICDKKVLQQNQCIACSNKKQQTTSNSHSRLLYNSRSKNTQQMNLNNASTYRKQSLHTSTYISKRYHTYKNSKNTSKFHSEQ